MSQITVISEQDIKDYRAVLVPWVAANGVDPKSVDLAPLVIAETNDSPVIGYAELLTDASGGRYVSPFTDRAATASRQVPLLVPLPAGIGTVICVCTLTEDCAHQLTPKSRAQTADGIAATNPPAPAA